MANSGIYKIVNRVNRKEYYGSAIDLNRRCSDHFRNLMANKHVNKHLQASYNTHGPDNFLFMILEYVEDESKLLVVEQNYLDVFWDGCVECYNICPVAGSQLGVKRSQDTIDKLSKANTGKTLSPEHRDNLSKALTGRKLSQEHRDNMIKAFAGKKLSQETRNKIAKALVGKSPSQETRNKIAKSLKGRKLTQEHRNNLSKAKINKK